MATIPHTGNFGQRVARSAPLPDIRMTDAAAQAGAKLAQGANNVLTDMAEQETRQRLGALAQQEQEAKQAAEAALRVKTLTALGGAKDALTDAADEIGNGVLDGSVPKEKAQATWGERAGKVLQGVGADLPEDRRALVMAELTRDADRFGNGIRKAVTQRDRQDVTAGISQTLEHLQRQYKADPEGATARAMSLIDQMGPHSTLKPEQLAAMRQGWKEGTQYTAAYELITAGRTDRKALDKAEQVISGGLPDLDPQKRATLLDRVAAYRLHLDQKAEVAAQRAQREAERRLKVAEAEFNTFQTMADKGTMLAPEYIDRALQATAGTPYAAGIKALAQQAREVGGLAAQPVATQRAQLQAIDAAIAQQGRTPELDRRRAQVEKVLRGSEQDMERDPLRAGLERGVITELQPLQPGAGLPGMIEQLKQRVPLAQRVGTWAGRPVSPMTADEAAMLKQQLDALPAKDRAGMVAAISQAVGPAQAQGLAAQMDSKDRALSLAFAAGGSFTTPATNMWGAPVGEGRLVSELILKGQQARLDGTSTKGQKQPELKSSAWRAHAAAALDGVFPDAQFAGKVRDAAELIMHGIAAEKGGELRRDDMDRAVQLAIGGQVVERNGQRLPLPAGVEPDAFEKRLETITADELRAQAPGDVVLAGGAQVPLAEFVASLPGQQLMPVRRGQFAVLVGGRPVLNAKGQPIIVGVR